MKILLITVAFISSVSCQLTGRQDGQDQQPKQQSDLTVITGGKVFTMNGEPIENGVVIFEKDRIKYVGDNRAEIPAGATVVDATGKILMPGFFDSMTSVGLVEIDALKETRDTDEASDPITPHVNAFDAYNIQSEVIPVTRINGITNVMSAPGSANPIAGVAAVVNLESDLASDPFVKKSAALIMNIGESPKSTYGSRNVIQTRMGLVAKIREALYKAQEYKNKKDDYEKKCKEYEKKIAEAKSDEEKNKIQKPEPPAFDMKREAMLKVLKGDLPVVVRARKADDILTALRLQEEFKFKMILSDAAEAWKVVDVLKEKNIPVLVGPISVQPSSMETSGATYQNCAVLAKNGILFAIQTGDNHNVRNLPYMAGLAVAYGLPWDEAIKAITINPAKILGVDDQIGSIKVGNLANVCIWDGDPLQPRSKILHVFIKGKEIPLESRQTRLARQYGAK